MEIAKNDPAVMPGAAGDTRNARFIPRNFLLDERIDAQRAGSYASLLPSAGLASFADWDAAHNNYLERHIFTKPPFGHDHHAIATDDAAVCPETFRSPLALATFQGTDLDTHFVRMMAVADIAWLSGRAEDEIFRLGEDCTKDPAPANPARTDLELVLEAAFTSPKCDHRPVFAAFYEDVKAELSDATSTTWANQLRDRLGLYHFNQWSVRFPRRVFLFRYAVRDIPRRQGVAEAERRPIAVPTVQDHRFSAAFCPAPKGLSEGQVVDLQPAVNRQPAREVLHLFMPLEPRHLFRVGTVTTPVPDYLGPARKEHIFWLRLLSDREDYAAATDHDLFQP